jgi:hypothetical protein
MRFLSSAAGVLTAGALLHFPNQQLSAQGSPAELRVTLKSGSGSPLSSALVGLVDEGGRAVVEGLSSESGRITLAAAPGAYRVRVRRIGYRPFLSDPVTLPRSAELSLHIESERIILDAMVVSAAAQCGRINQDALTLGTVWEEVEKALRSSQLTLSDLSRYTRARTYHREVDVNGDIRRSDTTDVRVTSFRPFGAVDPKSLMTMGYVRGDVLNGWDYFGPDERVLLSDDFTATHCFRVVRDQKRKGQIGVAFRPAPKRQPPDIEGIMWVDEKTSELREVRFQYVNAGVLDRFKPGGFTLFNRTPSGAWLVKEWQLRMPRLERGSRGLVAVSYLENGGLLIPADADSASAGGPKR